MHVINHVLCLGWCFGFGFVFFLTGLRPFKHSVIRITSSIFSANTEEGGNYFFKKGVIFSRSI